MEKNDIMYLKADTLRTEHHICSFLPQKQNLNLIEETSGKLRLRDDLQNNWTALFKIQGQQIQRMSEKLSQIIE